MMTLMPLLLALAGSPADTIVVPLQEVVVTGTRIPESAQRTPAAISVVDRRSFTDSRGISLKDALGAVPGVFVQSRSGAQDVRITIRGYGARGNGERSNTGNIRGIRVMTDGIPVTEPDGRSSLDLADLGATDRIEVSRSNSSTLYGNASGGVVNLRTDLTFDAPYLELRERAGSFGYHREQGVTGFTAGAGRGVFSLLNSTFDGWREHSMSTTTLAQARFTSPLGAGNRIRVMLDAVSNLNRFPGPLTAAQLEADPQQANPQFVARDDRRRNRLGRVALTLDREIEPSQDLSVMLFVEPKVLQRSERNRFRDFNRYHLGGSATWQLRSTITPGLEGVTLVGGDEAYQDGSILFYNLTPDGSRGTDLKANKREGANSAGLFLQQELRWQERWSLRLAARYDNLWYLAEDFITPSLDAEKTFSRWTPKGSLSYAFDHHTLYAALGGGVEAPAFNEIDPPPPLDTLTSLNPFLDAMHSTTWELGAKGEVASGGAIGRLRYDAALYHIEVANDIVPFDGGAYFFTAGKSRRRGVELGLDWLPIEAFQINAAMTLSDNKYVDYHNELGDFAGNRAPGLPRATLAGGARCDFPLGVSIGISAESAGEYFANDANTARVPAYGIFNATLGYRRSLSIGELSAYVAGSNLTDESYVASVFINGLNGEFYEPGLPQNWSGGLSLRFR